MLELPHTLVGAAIATKIPNPLVSFPLAIISHILIDFIPHWNPSLYTETKKYGKPKKQSTLIVFFDSSLSLILGSLVALSFWPDLYRTFGVFLACFGSVLPDVVEAPYFYLNYQPKALQRLIDWQRKHQGKAPKIPGTLVQIATIAIAIIIILS